MMPKSRLLTEMRTLFSYRRCKTFLSMSLMNLAPSATRNSPPPSVAGLKQTNAPNFAVFTYVDSLCSPTKCCASDGLFTASYTASFLPNHVPEARCMDGVEARIQLQSFIHCSEAICILHHLKIPKPNGTMFLQMF